MSNGLAKDIEWTKDYEAWQFAYCFIVFPTMDQSIKNHKEIYSRMKEIDWNNTPEAWMFKEGWFACYNKALDAINKVEERFRESFFE